MVSGRQRSSTFWFPSASNGDCEPVRIAFLAGEPAVPLVLLATSTRNASEVIAFAGGLELKVPGRTSEAAGTDRIVVEPPASLEASGPTALRILADGKESNAMEILF